MGKTCKFEVSPHLFSLVSAGSNKHPFRAFGYTPTDINNETNPASAWRMLTSASNISRYQPGDSVLLKAAKIFRMELSM